MKKIYILLLVLLSYSWSNAQTQGSDIIVLIDANQSITTTQWAQMKQSIEDVMNAVKGTGANTACNPDNRFAFVSYGANAASPSPWSSISLNSKFSNTIVTPSTANPTHHGEYLHDALTLLDLAQTSTTTLHPRILDPTDSTSRLTNTSNTRSQIIWIFTDAFRAGQITETLGGASRGSYLVDYTNSNPLNGVINPELPIALTGNDAFTNFRNYKMNRNTKFIVSHLPPNPESQAAAAAIASAGKPGNYTGPVESFLNDPDASATNRYYFPRDATQGFDFNTQEIAEIKQAFCEISNGSCITMDAVNLNCPTSNFVVTGTYNLNSNQSLTSITLQIKDGAGNVLPAISNPNPLLPNGTNIFSFTIDPNVDFGTNPSGNYEFEAFMVSSSSSPVMTFNGSDISANDGADVSFNNCCIPTYTTPNDITNATDNQKAANLITANKSIDNTSTVAYRAGLEIKLEDGFYAAGGSIVRLYNAVCDASNTYQLRPEQDSFKYRTPHYYPNYDSIENNSISNTSVSIYPNPNNGQFNVSLGSESSGEITITDMNGRTIHHQSYNGSEITVDMTGNANGVYIIQIVSGDNVVTKKLIKR